MLHPNTSSPDVEGHGRTTGSIRNYATWILTPFKGPDTMQNRTALFNSNAGKWAPMKAEKQPEHGRASTTKVQ